VDGAKKNFEKPKNKQIISKIPGSQAKFRNRTYFSGAEARQVEAPRRDIYEKKLETNQRRTKYQNFRQKKAKPVKWPRQKKREVKERCTRNRAPRRQPREKGEGSVLLVQEGARCLKKQQPRRRPAVTARKKKVNARGGGDEGGAPTKSEVGPRLRKEFKKKDPREKKLRREARKKKNCAKTQPRKDELLTQGSKDPHKDSEETGGLHEPSYRRGKNGCAQATRKKKTKTKA